MSKGGVLRKLAIEVDLSGNGQEELADWNRKLAESRGLGKSFTSGIGEMERWMKSFKDRLGEARASLGQIGGAIQGLATLSIGSKIIGLGGEMINQAAKFESASVSFEVMLGSAEKAQRVMADLTEFSNVTPFEPGPVIESGRQLLAFGVKAENLKNTLRMVGDVASGVGMDITELSAIYGKNLTSGLVQTEDLMQLAGRGIPIFDELAKVFGVSTEQIRGLASSGQIKFGHLQKVFENMTAEGGKYFGMMDKQSRTWDGLTSTLSGNADEMKRSIGSMFTDALRPLIEALGGLIGWILQNEAAMAAVKIIVLALVPAIGIFLVGSLWSAITALGIFNIGLIAALWPVYAIIAVIGLLALAIEDIYTWITGGDSIIGSWLGPWKDVIGGIRDFFVDTWNNILAFFSSIPERIVAALGSLKGLIPKLLSFILPPILYTFVAKATGLDIEGRAGGGPVLSGTPYIVGEQGPELFVPSAAGSIVPNGALSGNSTITIAPVITINGSASRDDADTIASAVIKAIEDALPAVRAQLGLEAV